MNKCTKCGKLKSASEFNFKIKKLDLRQKHCRVCTRALIRNHYRNNKGYYLKKALKRNDKIKIELVRYLQSYFLDHPCVDCGEDDIAVLEFDHTGKEKKLNTVSYIMRLGFPFEVIKREIDKCEVRCANCHRRKTAKDFNWSKIKTPL